VRGHFEYLSDGALSLAGGVLASAVGSGEAGGRLDIVNGSHTISGGIEVGRAAEIGGTVDARSPAGVGIGAGAASVDSIVIVHGMVTGLALWGAGIGSGNGSFVCDIRIDSAVVDAVSVSGRSISAGRVSAGTRASAV
jgi:hypothetical protein